MKKPEICWGQTLLEWNEINEKWWTERRRQWAYPEEFSNGLECPKCASALYDTGHMTNTSPNKLRVKCQRCDFRGERYE